MHENKQIPAGGGYSSVVQLAKLAFPAIIPDNGQHKTTTSDFYCNAAEHNDKGGA